MPNMNKFSGGSAELTGNAVASDVLSGKTFYSNNEEQKLTGTMANKGAITGSVGVGGSYTVPQGYHNGRGVVSGPTLSGNAAVSQVLSGRTFYSNSGSLQSGIMPDRGAWNTTINPGGSVTIPWGFHNGGGMVRANGVSWINFYDYKGYFNGSVRSLTCTINDEVKYLNVTVMSGDRPHKDFIINGVTSSGSTERLYTNTTSSAYKQANLDLNGKYYRTITIQITSNYSTNLSDIFSTISAHVGRI